MNGETSKQGSGAETTGGRKAAGAGPAGGTGPSGSQRGHRKTITGKVDSDRMRKTRTVKVMTLRRHPKYGKFIRKYTKYYVHDENEVSHAGDTVLIAETRPISRTKRWRVVEVLTRSSGAEALKGAVLADESGLVGGAKVAKQASKKAPLAGEGSTT